MQGARTVARSSCTVQAGDCRLPWMNVTRLRISVSCRMCLGALEQLQSRCFGALSALSCGRAGSARLVVIPPGVLHVEYVARGAPGAVFFRHAITAIYIHVLLLTSTGASPPPPRPVASLWSTQDRVLAGVRFRTDTPHDPVLSPSNRQTNPPKNSKTARKAPKPQATDAASC